MKKFLYKLLKNNKGLYDFIFNSIIEDRKIETIKKVIDNKEIIYKEQITDKNVDINNCIIIDTRIENCQINNMTKNTMKDCVISNNRYVPEKSNPINIIVGGKK